MQYLRQLDQSYSLIQDHSISSEKNSGNQKYQHFCISFTDDEIDQQICGQPESQAT